jgi:hypothetical protein
MERQPGPDKYVRLIEAKRDELSDDDMEVLLVLHEQRTRNRAAAELGMTLEQLDAKIVELFPPPIDERVTKKGERYKKRLTRAAYVGILMERDDLTEDDRRIIAAIAESPNQTVAAMSLGMSYKDYDRAHAQIRRKYDF